ncbi:MAG TPA: hypothetical protein ENI23_17175 [bacterium]|nr:hypothetical protein [bacterium]
MRARNKKLHSSVISFVKEVKYWRDTGKANYLKIAKKHIKSIGKTIGLDDKFLQYSESLALYESILYPLPGYRSHYVHQLNVFLNGYLILNWLDDSQFTKIQKIIARMCNVEEDSIDVFKIWFITAIFHDTGYPLGKVGDWTQYFLGELFKRTFDNIASSIVEPLSISLFRGSFRESINLLIQHLFTWLRPSDSQQKIINHEIHELFFKTLSENLIPGLILIRAAETSGIDICTLSTAVSAIVLDDERMCEILKKEKIKKQMSYVDHPLAFLLIYCDNIQEYGRVKSILSNQIVERQGKLPEVDEFEVKEQKLSMEENVIHCRLSYKKQPDIWNTKVRPILSSIREYWKSPSDLTFGISYETNDGEFDNLIFLRGPTKSR